MKNSIRRNVEGKAEPAIRLSLLSPVVATNGMDSDPAPSFTAATINFLVECGKLLISQSALPEFCADDVTHANGTNPSRDQNDIGAVEEREPREAEWSIVMKHQIALGQCAHLGILTRWKPTDQPTFFTSLAAFPATPALATSCNTHGRRVIKALGLNGPCRNGFGVLPC